MSNIAMEYKVLTQDEIVQLARLSDAVSQPCACTKSDLGGWTSMPATFEEDLLHCAGVVSAPSGTELTVTEFHPEKTNYWSPEAPIAPHYFPTNRCGVWTCRACGRCFLRYTEYGGYYVDKRIRALSGKLLRFDAVP